MMKLVKRSVFFLSLGLSIQANAISEIDYQKEYQAKVVPFFESGSTDSFKAKDGVELSFHRIEKGNKKLIFIMTGRTEPISKYKEVVYDLKDAGFDFLLLDSRGQGNSERELKDKQKGWVGSYKDYLTDIDELFKREELKSKYSEIVFLGHSMGAAIGLRYAELNPGLFSKIIVNSPMIELKLNDKNERLVATLMRINVLMGKGKDYIPGGGPAQAEGRFEENRVTSSQSRFEMARVLEREDPSLIMGASTNQWVLEGIKLGRKTYRKRKKLAKTPILLFQAGIEHFSRYKRQDKLCQELVNCEGHLIEEAKHEILMERDSIRGPVMKKILRFLK
ncbi:MAG: lysophospholipase [Bacteriovoracaceae bacterium]|jgi:lysophospholipase